MSPGNIEAGDVSGRGEIADRPVFGLLVDSASITGCELRQCRNNRQLGRGLTIVAGFNCKAHVMRPFALNAAMRSSCFAVEVSGIGKAVRWTSAGEHLQAEFCAWGKVSEHMTVLEMAAPTKERPQQHRRVTPERAGGVSARRKWQSAYPRRLAITDTIIDCGSCVSGSMVAIR